MRCPPLAHGIGNRIHRWAVLALATTACLAGSEPPAPTGLLIKPRWATLEPATQLHLNAAMAFPTGDTVRINSAVWSATGSGVATVDSTGLVTALATGIDTVVASFGDLAGFTVIVVGRPVLVGAGDIADCGLIGRMLTAASLDTIAGVVFTTGDNAYQDGTRQEYADCYAPSWGRYRARTRPTPGNHDYHTPGAWPYFAYFGPNAGDSGKGYYSFEIGKWHAIALNSNIPRSGGTQQELWLRADLAAHPAQCTIAYWHFPRFSSGPHGDDASVTPFWQALYDAGAEVVVSGHDHIYERFAPQTPDGTVDSARGIRQFVVGTGGGGLTSVSAVQPNSEVRITGEFGVLKLSLQPGWYAWRFIPVPGGTSADSGTTNCH